MKLESVWSAMDTSARSGWAIEGVIGGLGLLWGAPGVGKSFVAVSMAVSVATGRPWIGRRTHDGPVLYVAGEGGKAAVGRRMFAAIEQWSMDLEAEPVPIRIATPATDLTAGPQEVLRDVDEWGSIPKLVVIDTLSRCFTGDENKQEYMGRFVHSLDTIRDTYGCAVLVVHHSNRQGKVRGSNVLGGAADVSWHLTKAPGPAGKHGRETVMTADKLRERDVDGAEIRMRLASVPCRWSDGSPVYDEFGDLQTSLVVKPAKELVRRTEKLLEVAAPIFTVNGKVTYQQWRELFPNMGKSEFDAALSMMLTYPGQWAGLWQPEPGLYRLGATQEDLDGSGVDWGASDAS